jgi:hypothetical protein
MGMYASGARFEPGKPMNGGLTRRRGDAEEKSITQSHRGNGEGTENPFLLFTLWLCGSV